MWNSAGKFWLERTKANLGPPGVLLVCMGFGGLSFSVWGPVSLVAWRQRFSHQSAQNSISCPVGRGSIQEGGALEEWVSCTAPAAWSGTPKPCWRPQGPLAWVSAPSPLFSRSQRASGTRFQAGTAEQPKSPDHVPRRRRFLPSRLSVPLSSH